MSKKKLKKKIRKLEDALKRVLIERSEMRQKLSIMIYEPESYAGKQIEMGVRLEDDLDRQIFLGSHTDSTITKGIWRHLNQEPPID